MKNSDADALFIDNKEVATGPPPSYDRIHKLIAKRLRKLRHRFSCRSPDILSGPGTGGCS